MGDDKNKPLKIIDNTKSALNITISGMMPFIQHVIDPFLIAKPYWGFAIYAVIGLYGVYLALRQDELNELLDFINSHPQEFRKEIVESEEFRKGFIQFFDTYVKERLEKKRQILRRILFGFTSASDKENFELERLQDSLLRISPQAIEVLVFINKEILPVMKKNIEKEMENYAKNARSDEHNRLLDITWQRQSVSALIMQWIHDRYNSNSPQVKKQYNLGSEHNPDIQAKIAAIEHQVTKEKTECWTELLGLGIFRMNVQAGTFAGGSASEYHLTDFGIRFLKYIEES